MSIDQHLMPSEVLLVGSWMVSEGAVVADGVSRRIDFLKNSVLKRVGTDPSGWIVVYVDPTDGRHWELSFSDSGAHGGGAPTLRFLSEEEAKEILGSG